MAGSEQPIDVSVVVPTFRRHDLLARVLEALTRQELSPDRFEVIIADDDANSTTEELVRRWDANSPIAIRYVAVTATQGPAGARNAAWRIAHGAIVAFTDDDCIPDPDWLREGLAALGPETDALSGCVVVPHGDRPTDHERDTAGLATAEFVTANCFCRRTALAAVGGFDERFTMAWREDSDLQFTFLERGLRIDHAVRAIVVHPVRPARWGISLSQQRKSAFNSLLLRKHRELYRQRIPPFPRVYYAATAAAVCALVGWSIGHRVFAVGALAVWLLSVGWFCGKRLAGASKEPRHVAEMVITSALIPFIAIYWLIRGNVRYGVLRF